MSRSTRSRWARLAAGLSVIIFAIAGVWWVVESTNRLEAYLVAGADIAEGQAIESAALDEVYLATPGGNPGLATPSDADAWSGYVAASDIAAGSILLTDSFEPPPVTNETSFSVQVTIGATEWLVRGQHVDVWVSPPRDDQQFSVPSVAAPAARIVAIRQQEGFAADPDVLRVDLMVDSRDLPTLIHARANGFDIQLSPSVQPGPGTTEG